MFVLTLVLLVAPVRKPPFVRGVYTIWRVGARATFGARARPVLTERRARGGVRFPKLHVAETVRVHSVSGGGRAVAAPTQPPPSLLAFTTVGEQYLV